MTACLFICLTAWLSIALAVWMYIRIVISCRVMSCYVSMFVYLDLSPSIYVWMYAYLSVCLYVRVRPPVSSPIRLCLSICLSVCLVTYQDTGFHPDACHLLPNTQTSSVYCWCLVHLSSASTSVKSHEVLLGKYKPLPWHQYHRKALPLLDLY